MRIKSIVMAGVVAAAMPVAVLADDPRDPAMRSAAARARDAEIIRQLNLQELARVRARDAGFADGWRAYREGESRRSQDDSYTAQSRDYERDASAYQREREQYERDMARWRRDVAACQDGYYTACVDH